MVLCLCLQDIASEASLELVECFGQFEPALCSQYLSLHQSCAASLYLEDLLLTALIDPRASQQGALLHQRRNLLQHRISTNKGNGPVMEQVLEQLSQCNAWKRLTVSKDHVDLLKELPPTYNVVVLQHSPDK